MAFKVGWAIIYVSDMQRAVEFYGDTVGIGVRTTSEEFPEFVELATEGAILALHSVDPGWSDNQKRIGRPTGITITVPDIDSVYRSMSAKGVRFSQPPKTEPWGGKTTTFFDPDGNETALMEAREF